MKTIHTLPVALAFAASVLTSQAFELKEFAPNAPEGITLPVTYTGEIFGNPSGGYRRGATYEGLLVLGLDLDFEKLAGCPGLRFHLAGSDAHGASPSGKYIRDLNAVSNIDAYDTVRLYEAWVQQELWEGRLSIRLGQMLVDEEFFSSEGSGLFLNGAFGALPLVSQNLPAPVYPLSALGVRAAYKYSEDVALQVGLYDGNTGDLDRNHHNTRYRLSRDEGALALAELSFSSEATPIGSASAGHARAVYKLGAFYRNARQNVSVTDAWHTNTGGVYFIADQPLWASADGQALDAFLRIGCTPADRSAVPFYFDTGLTYKGLIAGREEDRLGLGFSHTYLSDRIRIPGDTRHESTLELTYKAKLNNWCELQPDVQYIFRPGATRDNHNALVLGVRCVLSF